MQRVRLIWITPFAEDLITYMARVSNPKSQEEGSNSEQLISYLIRNKHWSPFEMVHACLEIETTRDIVRQVLRHRSFSFQEFSQRYAEVTGFTVREARIQDKKNRQASNHCTDTNLNAWWSNIQEEIKDLCESAYKNALSKGIAKEQARAVLPEGLTMSRMYMVGSIRSWIHYLQVRMGNGTQLEHTELAKEIYEILRKELPVVMALIKNGK